MSICGVWNERLNFLFNSRSTSENCHEALFSFASFLAIVSDPAEPEPEEEEEEHERAKRRQVVDD